MADDEYEIISQKEIERLKDELEAYKGEKRGGKPRGNLQDSVNSLNRSINNLLSLFREASESMRREDLEGERQGPGFDEGMLVPLIDKIDTLLDENRKIAKGIVAIADMIRDLEGSMGPASAETPSFIEEEPEHEEAEEPPVYERPKPMPPPAPAPIRPGVSAPRQQRPMPSAQPPSFGFEDSEPINPDGDEGDDHSMFDTDFGDSNFDDKEPLPSPGPDLGSEFEPPPLQDEPSSASKPMPPPMPLGGKPEKKGLFGMGK